MNKVKQIIKEYIDWKTIEESPEYKCKSISEKSKYRLIYDEDAKYYSQQGLDDETALHADVIVSLWTIYKTLLVNEANYKTTKSLDDLKDLIRDMEDVKSDSYPKINEINKMILPFAEVCYTKGNYMLLPKGKRKMNSDRYHITEDRIDATLFECFEEGKLSKFFKSDNEVRKWIISQKLEMMFIDGDINPKKIKWMTNSANNKLISKMTTNEIMEYVNNAINFINERNKRLEND